MFVAPNASVIADVNLGERAVVWYGAVLRGDRSGISIGPDSSVGDRVVIHTTVSVALFSPALVLLHSCFRCFSYAIFFFSPKGFFAGQSWSSSNCWAR